MSASSFSVKVRENDCESGMSSDMRTCALSKEAPVKDVDSRELATTCSFGRLAADRKSPPLPPLGLLSRFMNCICARA